MLNPTRARLFKGGLRSDSSVTCPANCPLTLRSSGWHQLFCLELWVVMVKHRLKIKIGRIVTYLYTKFKMNALGIIKWNNSIGERHSNERPVDFQVDRNQQKALFKQIHLVKRKSHHHRANTIIHLLTFDLLTIIKWGSGKAECEQCLILKAMFVITKLKCSKVRQIVKYYFTLNVQKLVWSTVCYDNVFIITMRTHMHNACQRTTVCSWLSSSTCAWVLAFVLEHC